MSLAPVRITLRWKARLSGAGWLVVRAHLRYLLLNVTVHASFRGSLPGAQGRPPLDAEGRVRTQLALGPLKIAPGSLSRRLGFSWRPGRRPERPPRRSLAGEAARAFARALKGHVYAARTAAAFTVGAPDAMAAALSAAAVHAAASNAGGRLMRLASPGSPRPVITVRPAFGRPAHLAARGEVVLQLAAFRVSLALARAVLSAAGRLVRGSARRPEGAQRARAQRAAA